MSDKEEKKFTAISIPTPLFKKIEERTRNTGFGSVSSYVTYVLREIIAGEEHEEYPFSKEEEEMVKEGLRTMGYLD